MDDDNPPNHHGVDYSCSEIEKLMTKARQQNKPQKGREEFSRKLHFYVFFTIRRRFRFVEPSDVYKQFLKNKMIINIFKLTLAACLITSIVVADKPAGKKEKSWKDKDVRDMTDADMERLLDQWEEGDEPLEPDELPEHLRPAPKIDMSKIDATNPDNILRMTKQGKGVMMFVDVIPEKTVEEAETIMKIWQGSLMNNHIIAERYPIEEKRSVLLFREGSQAVDAKNYLLEQPELAHLTLEGQTYSPKDAKEKKKKEKKTKKNTAKTDL